MSRRRFGSLKQADYGPLGEMLEMVLSGGGKLLRPALALLAGRFGHYNLDLLVPLAASVELLHTATLVHDDVIDRAATRRGRPTVNSAFHNSTTVMLGDYLFAHAADQVVRTDNMRVVRLFSETLMIMAKGEIRQDLTAYDGRQTIRDYLQRIGGKTASLFATACEGGAIVSGQPDEWSQAFRDYGYNFGMAFQIVDDILDFTGDEARDGQARGQRPDAGNAHPPLAAPDGPLAEEQRGPEILRAPGPRPPGAGGAVRARFGRRRGVVRDGTRLLRKRARDALGVLPDIGDRQTLEDLTVYILERRA